MVTDEMVEKAARAMCEAWHYSKIGTPDGNAEWLKKQDQYRKQARAALEAALSAAEPVGKALELPYKNWRGEISNRKLQPIRLEFGATEWHPEPQWLLVAKDIEKNAERSFALKDFNPPQPSPSVAVKAFETNKEMLTTFGVEDIREGSRMCFEADGTDTWEDYYEVPFHALDRIRSAIAAAPAKQEG